MLVEGLENNIKQMREITRELYVFSSQLNTINKLENDKKIVIEKREKELLQEVIVSLIAQLKILNDSIPSLIQGIKFYKNFESKIKEKGLATVQYKPSEEKKVSLIISDKDKKEFLKNLSKSRLSINLLKKKYSVEKKVKEIGKPSFYAKVSNYFFKNLSKKIIEKGYFKILNRNLRKISSRFVLGTYISIIFFTILISFISSIFLFIILLFFDLSVIYPFVSLAQESILTRFFKFFWITMAIPALAGFLAYIYPVSEAKNLESRINQELPFVTIHMSAIASSGVEPVSIFEIILKSGEYKYTNVEFKKLMNLINFHGEDIISALRKISVSSPSSKLGELLNGLAFTINSGGSLYRFLNKHTENMMLDYKLEREKYTRISETFMDIYISVAIAAPMILLMLFVIIGSTGLTGGVFNLGLKTLSILLILIIVLLNVLFLILLKLKQPMM